MAQPHRKNILDDLFEMLVELPVWAGPLLIAAVYAAFYWLFPWMLELIGSSNEVSTLSTPIIASAARSLSPYVAGLATIMWIVSIVKKPRKEPGHEKPRGESSPPPLPPGSSGTTCPQCGADMVLRTTKTGKNAGSQFWGCSQFPNCRGTRSL